MLGQLCSQFLVLMVQVSLLLVFILAVFQVRDQSLLLGTGISHYYRTVTDQSMSHVCCLFLPGLTRSG